MEALEKKEIRLFRNKTMGNTCYRYFITSESQRDKFCMDRAYGSEKGPNITYHVYVDEDVDRTTKEYKSLFITPRLS